MKKKISKDEWFAAASAQDLWATGNEPTLTVIQTCGAKEVLFDTLVSEAEEICPYQPGHEYLINTALLAAQIGCEKAGL